MQDEPWYQGMKDVAILFSFFEDEVLILLSLPPSF